MLLSIEHVSESIQAGHVYIGAFGKSGSKTSTGEIAAGEGPPLNSGIPPWNTINPTIAVAISNGIGII